MIERCFKDAWLVRESMSYINSLGGVVYLNKVKELPDTKKRTNLSLVYIDSDGTVRRIAAKKAMGTSELELDVDGTLRGLFVGFIHHLDAGCIGETLYELKGIDSIKLAIHDSAGSCIILGPIVKKTYKEMIIKVFDDNIERKVLENIIKIENVSNECCSKKEIQKRNESENRRKAFIARYNENIKR